MTGQPTVARSSRFEAAFQRAAELVAGGVTDPTALAAAVQVNVETISAWMWRTHSDTSRDSLGAEFFARVEAARNAHRPRCTPDDYRQLRRALAAPTPTVISAEMWLDGLHPHTTPDDPEWPAPTVDGEVRELVAKFAPWQRLFVAVVAAEMAAAVWENSPDPDPETAGEAETVRGMVDAMWQQVWGIRPTVPPPRQFSSPSAPILAQMLKSAWDTANTEFLRANVLYASRVVSAAASVCTGTVEGPWNARRVRFFARWWMRSRCRLAVADAPACEFAPPTADDGKGEWAGKR